MQREVLKLSRHKNVLPKRKKVAAYGQSIEWKRCNDAFIVSSS